MNIELVVPGIAVPKLRPVVPRNRRAFTPKKCVEYEKLVRNICYEKIKSPSINPIIVKITIYIIPPKSWSAKKTDLALSQLLFPTSRPDLDNLVKSILDGLEGVAYLRDSQVVDMSAFKRYGTESKAIILLKEHNVNKKQQ